jgi:hypothetical protein
LNKSGVVGVAFEREHPGMEEDGLAQRGDLVGKELPQ